MSLTKWKVSSAQRDGEHGEGRWVTVVLITTKENTISLIMRKKTRVSSSLHSIHYLSSPRSCFTHVSGSCLKLPPWLALKVTGRPQPSGSDSPVVPLHVESFLRCRWWKSAGGGRTRPCGKSFFIIYFFYLFLFFFHNLQMQRNAVPCSSVHHETMRSNHSPLSAPPGRRGEQRLTGLNAPISHVLSCRQHREGLLF